MQRVRRRQAEGDRERRRDGGGPQREPRDAVHAGPGEHVQHGAGGEPAVDDEPLGQHAAHGQHEEHAEDQDGARGERQQREQSPRLGPRAGRGHREMTSVHSVSQSSRFAAISAGSTS